MRRGEVIGGRFEVEQLAGSGGMGEVYRALDRQTGQPVALKIMLGSRNIDAARFEREARFLASIDHPLVVNYVAHGALSTGEPYLAMEWLDGEDLAARLARERLSVAGSLTLAITVAEALGALHERDIVHRDMKPSNIFLRGGRIDQVKLLDFGLARDKDSTHVTATGALLGTVGYMAPEQARGASDLDARADIFALGCVLFECLTGEAAFSAPHATAILTKILFEEAPRLSGKLAGAPPELDALLARMLSKQAADRPANGRAVADALRGLWEVSLVNIELDTTMEFLRPASLTDSEQRAVAVILLRPPDAPAMEQSGVKTVAKMTQDEAASFRAVAAAYNGELERLIDGTEVVVLSSGQVASDLAAQAAQCAMSLARHAPGRRIALAMGRGMRSGRLPLGPAIERAARLLDSQSSPDLSEPRAPIALDEVAAGLLEARFSVRDESGVFTLMGERDVTDARTLLGKPTPCVGRERELRHLEQLFNDCVDEGAAQAIVVRAPPGVGKSRLGRELLQKLGEREEAVEVWIGRGDAVRAGSAFGLLGQVLRGALGVRDGEPLELRREKVLARVAAGVAEPERKRVAAFLGEIIGTPFPEDDGTLLRAARRDAQLMNDQMRAAFLDFLAAECARRPVAIVLEDLHWGDRPTVQFIDRALRELRERPLFVLALARPEVDDLFPRLWTERRVHEIRLKELSRKAVEKLVHHALGQAASPKTIERLASLSEGNAFYLEELIRWAAEGHREDLPETVVAMVHSRLGKLHDESRRVLRAASIFGEVFWAGGISALLGGLGLALVRRLLAELVDQELLVQRRDSRFSGEHEHAFRHALLREGAYAMLTEQDRALGHKLAGGWLEQRGEQDALVLAEHFQKGGDGARAGRHSLRAAEKAYWAGDTAAVISMVRRALACELTPEVRLEMLGMLCEIHFVRPDLTSALIPPAEDLLRVSPGSGVPWVPNEELGYGSSLRSFCFAWTLAERGAVREARAWASSIAELGRAQGLLLDEGRGRWVLSEALRRAGELDAADAEIKAALEMLRMACPLDYPAALATLAALRLSQDRPAEALAAAEQALAKYESMGVYGFFPGAALRLVHAESLAAAGEDERARDAIAAARERILAASMEIADPIARASYLERVREHARTLELAAAWLGEPAPVG